MRPKVSHGFLILGFSRSHSTMHHIRQESSGRVISWSQRFLPDNTQIHNRQVSTPPVGFEPKIVACQRSESYTLDCTATGTGNFRYIAVTSSVMFDVVLNTYRNSDIYAVQQDTQSFLMSEFYSSHMLARHVSDLIGTSSGAFCTSCIRRFGMW